jgi:hypothetical protein
MPSKSSSNSLSQALSGESTNVASMASGFTITSVDAAILQEYLDEFEGANSNA